MSPASYLTAPPRGAPASIAPSRDAKTPLRRREAGCGRGQPVDRTKRRQRAVGRDLPAEHAARIRVQAVQKPSVAAQRLVAQPRLSIDGPRGDRSVQLDTAVVADRIRRDRAVAEV